MELAPDRPIFVGFKLDSSLRRQLESVSGPDRRYLSAEDPQFLMLCRRGEDVWVGKLIQDRLTTDRVEDVRRNVLSIMRRLCPEVRLPAVLEIVPASENQKAAEEPGPPFTPPISGPAW